jgi:hypothetical protein
MRLKLLKKDPVDHSMRRGCHAPETLDDKGFPWQFAAGDVAAPRRFDRKLSPYHDGMAETKHHVRTPSRNKPAWRYEILANAASAAAIVAAMSSGLCAEETKPASNADGAR